MDTSVLIALADPLDRFHTLSVSFVNSLKRRGIECLSGSPLLVELGRMAETRGTERCLDVINSMEEFVIHLNNIDLARMLERKNLS